MKRLAFFCISGIIIALDQITKILILKNFTEGESKVIIQSFFDLTLVYNKGAAFGFLSSLPEALRAPFFFIIPVAAVAVLLWLFFKGQDQSLPTKLGIALIIGGALGNFLDRLQYNQVVDFLLVYWPNCPFNYLNVGGTCYWPAFNVADSAITVGIGLMIVSNTFVNKKAKASQP